MTRKAHRTILALLATVFVLAAALGFGMTSADAHRIRGFRDAVRGWQTNPDYRAVSVEYVTLGVEAMQARWCGITAGNVVMGFRSIPGLPDHLAVSDTSTAHYDAFSRGEVSAYLHLASEQGFADGLAMIEKLGREPPSDADVVAFLAGFKLPVPTVTDPGAVAGVRRLLADVGPMGRPFTVRGDVATPLRSHVGASFGTSTRAEQAAMFAQLDDNVRAIDRELWRSKQVSDFLAGIWAQGYGQVYLDGIDGFFRIQRAARVVFVATTVVGAVWLVARRRLKPPSAAPSPDSPPQSLAGVKPG